ncbi:hypothetical protein [Streptomyces sp. NPDC055036]
MAEAVLVHLDAHGVRGVQGVGEALRGVDLLQHHFGYRHLVVVRRAGGRVPELDRVPDGPVGGEFITAVCGNVDVEANPGAFSDGVLGGLAVQAEVAEAVPAVAGQGLVRHRGLEPARRDDDAAALGEAREELGDHVGVIDPVRPDGAVRPVLVRHVPGQGVEVVRTFANHTAARAAR